MHALPAHRKLREDFAELFHSENSPVDTYFDKDFSWVSFYSLTHLELSDLFFSVSYLIEEGLESEHSPACIETIEKLLPNCLELEKIEEPTQYHLGLFIALSNTITCIETYGKSLNQLLEEYSDTADRSLLKRMLKLDRAVLAHPYVARNLASAHLVNDSEFFQTIKLGLSGVPTTRIQAYAELRYCMAALHQAGILEQLTGEEKYTLFCEELKLYPQSGSDPKRSLER